jgi:hypothetical protein
LLLLVSLFSAVSTSSYYLQAPRELADARRAFATLALQRLADELLQLRVAVRDQRRERWKIEREKRWIAPAQQMVQRCTKRVHIRAWFAFALVLFRSRITNGADGGTLSGEVACNSEIDQLDPILRGHNYVGGLQIAIDHRRKTAVQVVERIADLQRDIDRFRFFEPAASRH